MSANGPTGRTLLRDEVYAVVREAVLDQVLEPGEVLRIDDLVRWLGVSRGPIREALVQLEYDGLVDIRAQQSTRVAPLDAPRAIERLLLVGDLTALGLRLSGAPLDAQAVEALRHEVYRADESSPAQFAKSLAACAHLLVSNCGNHRLTVDLAAQSAHLRRELALIVEFCSLSAVSRTLQEVWDAALRDGAEAADLIHERLDPLRERYRAVIRDAEGHAS